MSTLSDIDFAKAGLDLTSWVLEDDLYHQQDFCYGAKQTQSISAGIPDCSSSLEAAVDFQDIPMETGDLSWSDVCKLNEYFSPLKKEEVIVPPNPPENIFSDDLDLQKLMKEEIVQQEQFNQLQFYKQKEEEKLRKKQEEQELLRLKQEQELLRSFEQQAAQERLIQQQQQSLAHDNSCQEPEVQEILYQELESPVSCPSSSSSPLYYCSGSIIDYNCTSSAVGPYIISVPVSEAVIQDDIQSVQPSVPQFVIQSPSLESQEIRKDPERLVINVKKVSLSSKSSARKRTASQLPIAASPRPIAASPRPIAASPPTLKEALEGNEADEFIREMLISPPADDSSRDSSCDAEVDYYCDDSMSLFSPASTTSSSSSPQSRKACGTRGNPYSITEKKLRKKEQNKRAALRYRQKKKEEEGGILSILKREEEYQKKLLARYDTVRTELKLMKKLAREMLIAQGKLKQ